MCDLTQYKDILGKPGEGLHFHVANLAMVDVLLTILLGYLLGKWLKINPWVPILLLFILGELLHWAFGVETTVIRLLRLMVFRS